MERIGSQVRLPLRTAMQISLQGIRIRLGRSLVTISGVVLGIAFLMSVLTGQLIKRAVSNAEELRQTVKLMESLVTTEIGTPSGKTIAVAVFGTITPEERSLLQSLTRQGGIIRGYNTPGAKTRVSDPGALGAEVNGTNPAQVLLVLGDARQVEAKAEAMIAGMTAPAVMLDTLEERQFQGSSVAALDAGLITHKWFFGDALEDAKAKLQQKATQENARTVWVLVISLLVTVIGIANALLMSVTERFKEIGTMKCLGALSSFIRRLFLIESAVIGLAGSVVGVLLGMLFPMLAYSLTFGAKLVFGAMDYRLLLLICLGSVIIGTVLSLIAAILPANFAARMVPASALRSNI